MHILTRFFSQKKFLDAFISGKLYSDRQKLKKRKNWPLFKKNCSRKSKSQATQRFF